MPTASAKRRAARERTLPTAQPKVARERKQIDPASADLNDRFALHLRSVMDRKKWSVKELAERLQHAGMSIDTRAIDTWLRGEAMPKAKDLETVGTVCGFKDYRYLLPPPLGG